MTSNDLSSVETLIICDLCSKLYEDPRSLPCFHSYCFRCIKQIIATNKDHFACPSCDDGIKITQNDIDSLPSNRILQDIVELYVLMKHSPVCSICESSTAECRCNKCQMYYCSKCYEDIHSKGAFQSHSRTSINDKSSEIILCDKHPDEKLKHWCQDCHTLVCSDCLLYEHKGHKSNLINQGSKELEIKIKIDLENIQSSLNHELNEADTRLLEINTDSEENKTEVCKAMTSLRQIIDEHEKQMLQHIENFQKEKTREIQDYKKQLENQLKNFDLQKYFLDLHILINDQIRLLKNKSTFFNYIHQINEQLEELQLPTGIDYHITGRGLLNNIKELIQQCARVTETSKQIISISEQGSQMEKLIVQYQTNQEVDFSRQSLTDQNIHIVIEILKKTNKMLTLNLSNNQIGPQGVQNLVDVLQNNKILTTLDISNNEINDDGAKYLANFLKNNSTLTTLYLYDNGISEQGTQYLADVLKTNTKLEVLDLQSNELGYFGAQYLADALRKNKILTTLYLSNNQIGNEGAQHLADALQQNTTLTGLTLSDNQIDHEGKRRVLEMLKANKRLAVYW